MTNEQIVEKIRSGCATVYYMQMLYEENLPLIKKIIKPYVGYEQEEDLLQEAYFGLLEAVNRYETSENVKFMTYAGFWIKQSAQQYVERYSSVVRIPNQMYQRIMRYKRFVSEYYNQNGKYPTDKEVAKDFKISVDEIEKFRIYSQPMISLDAPTDVEGVNVCDTLKADFSLEDDVVDKMFDDYRKNELWGVLERYITPREKNMIIEYFINRKTVSELANEQGLSRNRISQIINRALQKLRQGMAKRELLEKFEVIMSGLYRTGINDFQNSWESSVERIAIKRVNLEEEFQVG